MHRVEHLHPNALLPQRINILRRHGHHAAEIIQNQIYLHPCGSALGKNPADALPNLPFGCNIILQKDEALGLFHLVQQILQIRLTRWKICHFRIGKHRKILPLQILRKLTPPGPPLCQRRLCPGAALLHRRGLLRHSHRLQCQLLFHLIAVPQEIKDQPHHRHQHNKNDPAGLIGTATRTHIQMQNAQHTQHLQNRVTNVHFLPKYLDQHYHQGNLQQKQQCHQSQAQSGRYSSLCFALNSFHGGIILS